jgi:hypothetical protein
MRSLKVAKALGLDIFQPMFVLRRRGNRIEPLLLPRKSPEVAQGCGLVQRSKVVSNLRYTAVTAATSARRLVTQCMVRPCDP